MPPHLISKSKYLQGLQCSKLLWYVINKPDKISPPDAAQQAIFDQGHLVGDLARTLFPGGILIGGPVFDFAKLLSQTQTALTKRKPLFEAAFKHGVGFARVDILNPVAGGKWDIIEVKSSTQVKDVNLHDLSLQRYVYSGSGINLRRCHVLHINNQYVRDGEIDPEQLFTQTDVTEEVKELLPAVPEKLAGMLTSAKAARAPKVKIGPHCSDPYDCPLMDHCWKSIPDVSVFNLSRIGAKAFDILEEGILDIEDIPDDFHLSASQSIQVEAHTSGKPHIDRTTIREFLDGLEYPLYFLDFETFGTAIPFYNRVRPYQQVPFQFSLHILRSARSKPEHHSFLADGSTDPRPEFLRRLKNLLGTDGSIIGYNVAFEKSRLKESVEGNRADTKWYEEIEPRFLDLYAPFRSFSYYHPDQKGSASIKAVLPVLTNLRYDDMEISDGGTASSEFLRITFGGVEPKEKNRVRKQLEEYCKLDTLGMVEILNALRST